VAIFFLAGFGLRFTVFSGDHDEGDELIYSALAEQLEQGNGYTLRGTALLASGALDRQQYDRELFFHPPGGVGLFWLSGKLFGASGTPVVQIFSYAVFFASMIFMARILGLSHMGIAIASALCAFNPVMAHVATHYWLDGPLLAFSTLSAAVFLFSVTRKSYPAAVLSGLILGYASLIKITAFLVFPGAAALAWVLMEERRPSALIRYAACLLLPAVVLQLPWEIWQWAVFGTPFPGWAGKPSAGLVASNRYVYFLTVVRSPWIYLTLLPRILWTIVPAVMLFFFTLDNREVRWRSLALLLWISVVLSFHVLVGYRGYSKVIRYVILVAPAAILLFSMVASEAVRRLTQARTQWSRGLYALLVFISLLAFLLEVAAGVKSSLLYGKDLIFPFIGGL